MCALLLSPPISYHKKVKCLITILSLYNKYKIQLIKYSFTSNSK